MEFKPWRDEIIEDSIEKAEGSGVNLEAGTLSFGCEREKESDKQEAGGAPRAGWAGSR